MPDFVGRDKVKLQPETRNYPISFSFSACTAFDSNDGSIPYGDSVESAAVKAYDPDGVDVSSSMVTGDAEVEADVVYVPISYYTGCIEGNYKLTIIVTCSSGFIHPYDFERVVVLDS